MAEDSSASTTKFREIHMDSTGAPLSLNSGCITAKDSAKIVRQRVIPHHRLPSSGSCHDICKYGKRRHAFEEEAVKPLHKKRTAKLVVPTLRKREILDDELYAEARKQSHLVTKKSFPRRPKIHSSSGNTDSPRGSVVVALPEKVRVQMKETSSVARKNRTCDQSIQSFASMRLKPVMVKPSPASDNSDGVQGKRIRKENVLASRNTRPSMMSAKRSWMPALSTNTESSKGRKTARVELLSPRKDRKRVRTNSSYALESIQNDRDDCQITWGGNEVDDHKIEPVNIEDVEENQIKFPRIEIESNDFEFEFESVTDTPSLSDEASDKLISDTTSVVSERKRNLNKRQRKSRAVRPGDKQCRALKLKFRIGNTCQHKDTKTNVPTRLKFRKTKSRVNDVNKSTRMGLFKTSRNRDKYRSKSSKNSCRRVRYVKARVLVLEQRKGDSKSDYDKKDHAGAELLVQKKNLKQQDLQGKKDVQCLFNYVIEETASKLAERRKGMVKSLVGAFETLISLQARKCFLRIAR